MRAGFTLLELLVVVLIITILGAVVGVQLADEPHKARVAAATAQLGNFKLALNRYRMDNGYLPTQQQGLAALCEAPTIDPLPQNYPEFGYLDSRTLPLDPWGNPYVYLIPGRDRQAFEIISYGADGEPGGEGKAADLTSS
jgi:general secretion pathway protein G